VFPRRARLLLALALAGLAVHLVHGLAGIDSPFVETGVYGAVHAAAVGLALWRVLARREERLAWAWITAGLACALLGDVAWTFLVPDADPGFPSPADPFYLAAYAAMYAGLLALVRARLRGFRPTLWLDGLLGGLTLGALAAALMFDRLVAAGAQEPRTIAITLLYPLAHLLQVLVAAAVFGLYRWRPGRAWALLLAGAVLGTVADAAYGYGEALGTYEPGGPIATLWLGGHVLIAWAAWQPPTRGATAGDDRLVIALPMAFAALCLGLLAYGRHAVISDVGASLALAALTLVLLRFALTLAENGRLLERSRREALTDGLTGLPNRRRLMRDLEDALTRPGTLLALYDLDGFKAYNDTHGHAEGDVLLARLGERLAGAVEGRGRAFRLGGDEFCVLADGSEAVRAAALALSDFGIVPSLGTVTLGVEADSPSAALRVADARMYADKRTPKTRPDFVGLQP
jgi:two-component system cell cycle response regulator